MADRVIAASEQYQVEVTTIWAGGPGPGGVEFHRGAGDDRPGARRSTAPSAWRRSRPGPTLPSAWACDTVTTHVGFIPENPGNPLYPGLLDALREVVAHCAERGLTFCFETGQETPTTLLRVIEDLGGENLGINLDPANLLMYGKANPVDALDVFGTYVRGVHAKDGEYPTNGRELGVEKPLGEGRVHFTGAGAQAQGAGLHRRADHRARDQRAAADRGHQARDRDPVQAGLASAQPRTRVGPSRCWGGDGLLG